MAVTIAVVPQLNEEQAAAVAAAIRTLVRAAVHAGIRDALNDLTQWVPIQDDDH